MHNDATGALVASWTSPSIAAGAEQQYAIKDIEREVGIANPPNYYSLSVQSGITGYFQHVLYRPADGTLTNLSTCMETTTSDATKIAGVHSSIVGDLGFPSSIAVNNTGAATATVTLGIYDARNGNKLGSYTTDAIPSGGLVVVTVATMETSARIARDSAPGHYVVKAESTFTGFIQHLVYNQKAGVITDMTTACIVSNAMSADVGVGSPTAATCIAPLVAIQSGTDSTCKGGETHMWPLELPSSSCHAWQPDDTSGRQHNNSASNIQCNGDGTFSFVQFAGNLECGGTGVLKTYRPNTCARDIPPTLFAIPTDLACCSAPGSAACKRGLPSTSVPGSKVYLNGQLCTN